MVADDALVALLHRLDRSGYDFVTPTPLTHERVVSARHEPASSLRDIFGWSLPFSAAAIEPELLELLRTAEAVTGSGGELRSRYRVSRVGGHLFLHSAYPTDQADSIFLGPDTYRFVRFVAQQGPIAASRLIDMGSGSGAGGICAAAMVPDASVVLVDSNPEALRLSRINAAAAGVAVETIEAASLDAVDGEFELVIANPPYLADPAGRAYRDGGGALGGQCSLDWALSAAARLAPGGRVLLYSGSAIVAGEDALRTGLEQALPALGCTLRYEEIDPDIFGEELDQPAYRGADRIAAIGAVIERS